MHIGVVIFLWWGCNSYFVGNLEVYTQFEEFPSLAARGWSAQPFPRDVSSSKICIWTSNCLEWNV